MSETRERTELISLACGDCIVQVTAFPPYDDDPRTGDLFVTLISGGSTRWHGMWRNRIKNAWKVLRNDYDWTGFELFTPETAAQFAKAIEDGSAHAWVVKK